MKFYLVYKNNGLYDPVLDDQEPIYEPIDPEGFDRPSQPTEVFHIQQFLDPNDSYYENQDPNQMKIPFNDEQDVTKFNYCDDPSQLLFGDPKLSESRSLTASPFILTTKPYRPFSTEPLGDIPALEDPIILNLNYKDEFGEHGQEEDILETKFKLPISEQYDPDWKRKEQDNLKANKAKTDTTLKEIDRNEVESINVNTLLTDIKKESKIIEEFKVEQMTKEEIEFTMKMKQELDINKIEMTATNIVNESIEKALSVANEIKTEIDVELLDNSTSTNVKEITDIISTDQTSEVNTEVIEVKNKSMSESIEFKSETESVSLKDTSTITKDATNKIIDNSNAKVKLVEKLTSSDEKDQSNEERKRCSKQDIEETIEVGNVRRKSMVFDKKTGVKEAIDKDIQKEYKEKQVFSNQESSKFETSQKTDTKTSNKMSTSRLLAEQRAYTIGLQTIPNIRGSIQTNYHYNLLLKTFFIHLTDVMVALSRFILTEPVLSKTEESQETKECKEETVENVNASKSSKAYEKVTKEIEVKDSKKDKKSIEQSIVKDNIKAQEDRVSKKSVTQAIKVKEESLTQAIKEEIKADNQEEIKASKLFNEENKIQIVENKVTLNNNHNNLDIEGEERYILSGSKMAQLSEKKSEELTIKMDAVISEFQNKAGIEESEIQIRNRRSRSRSQVEEEVMKESDPLEWLAKRDSRGSSQEITETKTSTKVLSSTVHSAAQKRLEVHESKQVTTTKPKEKQMYVAIVEAHVFTNKDAIFEEQLTEFSETSSIQSADEVNIAFESNEAVSTENVTIENKGQLKEEVAQLLVEDSNVILSANVTKETEVQISESINAEHVAMESKKQVKEEVVQSKIETQTNREEFETIKEERVSLKEESISTISKKSEVSIDVSKKESIDIQLTDESISIDVNQKKSIQDISKMHVELAKEEIISEEKAVELAVTADVKVENVIVKDIQPQIEAAELKITKEEIVEVEKPAEIRQENKTKVVQIEEALDLFKQDTAVSMSKFIDISQSSSCDTIKERSESYAEVQESSFTAKSVETSQKLTLRTDLAQQVILEQSSVQSDENNNIDTPTPSTVPPTPLTDEYMFKLQIPLPKITQNIIIQEDEDPNIVKKHDFHEDPNIVKKKLVPHIETNLESPIIYDPPLPTPPADTVVSPVYTKPGLRGGADNRYIRKEEILEIERKSSLLASAIDETIKSIEEYKEQVGIETKMDVDYKETSKIEYTSKTENVSTKETVVKVEQEDRAENIEANYSVEEEYSELDKENSKNENELSNSANVDITEINDELSESLINKNKSNIQESINEVEKMNADIKSEVQIDEQINNESISSEIKLEEICNADSEQTKICDSLPTLMANSASNIDNTLNETETNININENVIEIKKDETFELKSEEIANQNNETVIKVEINKIPEVPQDKTEEGEKRDPLLGFRSVVFNPEDIVTHRHFEIVQEEKSEPVSRLYMTPTGEILGTVQGIVDGLEEATVDDEVAKELGKPGMTEEKIAELISGESEMLREAHVMGLTRVLTSHMNRTNEDDSSVDFKKIKPIVESLHNSEVLKALNEEFVKTKEEKKKIEKKWTTFLQKPQRPVPKAKFGYYAYVETEDSVIEEPYKVKIVKQAKPKVAPDYKPENFDTGPLPWEERAQNEPTKPPIEAEEPILVPEEVPEFLEAVDPLPESEVPDLEDTGIKLPPPEVQEEVIPETEEEKAEEVNDIAEPEIIEEENQKEKEDMEENKIANQLMASVQSMVDPNASLEQQLVQMRAQLTALAQLPGVIQQTLEMVTKQLSQIAIQGITAIHETQALTSQTESNCEDEANINEATIIEEVIQNGTEDNNQEPNVIVEENDNIIEMKQPTLTEEEMEKLKIEEEEMLEEQRRIEKQKKELLEQMKQEQESRQLKQRPTPRVGKPKPVFGPSTPQERPLVLPGGRKWRGPKDAYNEQMFAETLSAQAEIIQGKTKGLPYESALLPYDKRINFMKYEKPPVSLDHLQHSDVYKLVHNMDQTPVKRVEMLTPVMSEADYREKCRSVSPCVGRMQKEQHLDIPQQLQP